MELTERPLLVELAEMPRADLLMMGGKASCDVLSLFNFCVGSYSTYSPTLVDEYLKLLFIVGTFLIVFVRFSFLILISLIEERLI